MPPFHRSRFLSFLLVVLIAFLIFTVDLRFPKTPAAFDLLNATVNPCRIRSPKSREEIWKILQECDFKIGIELGVWKGDFSENMLKNWKSCTKYYLVDPWLTQKNYKDRLNLENDIQNKLYEDTKSRLKQWEEKTTFLRHTSREAAPKFLNDSIDFIYIDARHDYCATKEDIELYWDKLHQGGILSGHDYKWTGDAGHSKREPGLDWGICENGERHEGAVKRAVDEFVDKNKLKLVLTGGVNPSWMMQKP